MLPFYSCSPFLPISRTKSTTSCIYILFLGFLSHLKCNYCDFNLLVQLLSFNQNFYWSFFLFCVFWLCCEALCETELFFQTFDELFCKNDNEPWRALQEIGRRSWMPDVEQHVADADRRRWDYSPELVCFIFCQLID